MKHFFLWVFTFQVSLFGGVALASDKPSLLDSLPNPEAFKGWVASNFGQSRDLDPHALASVAVACDSQLLYPTHPQMSLKEYYGGKGGSYDPRKLLGKDRACSVSGRKSEQPSSSPCIAAHIVEYIILADTYQDSCGNYYRGFLERLFFRREEKLETLFSPGRYAIRDNRSQIPGEVYVGSTTAVAASDFYVLAPLFEGDAEKVEALRAQALKGGFTLQNRIYRSPRAE